MNSWFVYIIECSDGSLYTGITNNVIKRMKTHSKGKGSKYVRSRLPFILKRVWEVENKSVAAKMEYKIKQLKRDEKIKLILS